MYFRAATILVLMIFGLVVYSEVLNPGPGKAIGCNIADVIDGDTVSMGCDGKRVTARLLGFDTPEITRPKCRAEAVLGFEAKAELKAILEGSQSTVLTRAGQGSQGRPLFKVEVDGQNVKEIMISKGLAVSYKGGKRVDWCAKLEASQ